MKQLSVNVRPLVSKIQIILEKLAEARLASKYRVIFKGEGLEFEDYRVYTENDDSSRIDWKASMRANKTLIKEYIEERDLDINILLDTSSSMVFGSTEKLKNEFAAEVVAALSYIIIKTGDCPGLYMFNDEIVANLPPANNKHQYYFFLRKLVDTKNYGGKCNLSNALQHVINFAKKKGVLIVISDFFGLDPDWEHYLKTASAKFDTIAIMIRDPRDEVLPKDVGKVIVSDPFSGSEIIFDPDNIADEYEEYAKQQKALIKHKIMSSRAQLMEVRTDKDFIKEFLLFFQGRERELT